MKSLPIWLLLIGVSVSVIQVCLPTILPPSPPSKEAPLQEDNPSSLAEPPSDPFHLGGQAGGPHPAGGPPEGALVVGLQGVLVGGLAGLQGGQGAVRVHLRDLQELVAVA